MSEFRRPASRQRRRGTHSGSVARRPQPSQGRLFRRRAYHFSPSKRTHRRMSEIDRHSDLTRSPLPKEDRILMRALGSGVEALVAQLGAKNAIKRVETELRRARRARSRKLHAFWSGVLVRIETETDEQRNPKPPRGARRIASLGNDAGPEG